MYRFTGGSSEVTISVCKISSLEEAKRAVQQCIETKKMEPEGCQVIQFRHSELNFLTPTFFYDLGIPEGVFRNNFKKVYMGKCKISYFPAALYQPFAPNLIDIELNDIQVKKWEANAFSGLSKLRHITIIDNKETRLPESISGDLIGLIEVRVEKNRFPKIPPHLFGNNLPNLTILFLIKNEIEELPGTVFAGLVNLVSLYLFENKITVLETDLFKGMTKLEDLNLNNNRIKTLPETIFRDLITLRSVILSKNYVEDLPEKLLHNCGKLERFEMGDNRVRGIPPAFFANKPLLTEIHMETNKITGLTPEVFHNLEKLRRVCMSTNRIETLMCPPSIPLFIGAPNLWNIEMQENNITELVDGTFDCLKALTVLSFYDNRIRTIGKKVFDNLPTVTSLNLGGNDISEVTAEMFEGLVNATTIHLSRNQLRKIPRDLFKNNPKLENVNFTGNYLTETDGDANESQLEQINVFASISDLTKLTCFDVSANPINAIPLNAFQNLKALRYLFIEETDMSVLAANSFAGLENLRELVLAYNRISVIEEDAFKGLDSVYRLNLRGNRIRTIKPTTFLHLPKLRRLVLEANQLEELNSEMFKCLPQLVELLLGKNLLDIGSMSVDAFSNNTNLVVLSLSYNRLRRLPPGLLVPLKDLRKFDFDGNPVVCYDSNVLGPLPKLQFLRLKDCNIKKVKPGAFSNTPILKEVNLENNQLGCLSEESFTADLSCLVCIMLRKNRFGRLDADCFKNLPKRNELLLNVTGNHLLPYVVEEFEKTYPTADFGGFWQFV